MRSINKLRSIHTSAQPKRACSEMYLLSLTDVLITISWSTFGYVAQSLGGLTPWITGE
ncbi:putative Type 1 galactoside alpha-(1,2)-fucosyltransferase [Rosa chinensis]|uniref:Fucosyltransferase n=1 Tax=Rosa chinensis TaxID=74649 RepID=A0A2P6REZ2_ROSCH|nr:putative Type 1 galactoside alpha-(1,2)-fucosyltransferase [Rosa chinensis]